MTETIRLLADFGRYAGLCGISLAAGLGILHLLKSPLAARHAAALAPAVALSWLAVALGCGVSMGVPVRLLAAPIWAATGALAAYGLAVSARKQGISWRDARLLLPALLVPVCVLSLYFRFGLADYPGSPLPDGWSYIAFGQYVWTYPIGTNGGLAPLYQYAAHMSDVRHVSADMLALLSPLFTAGDTQASSGLFLAWALFVLTASCTFFALTVGLCDLQVAAYSVFVVASGWIMNLLWANNYDNALALSFPPVLAGLVADLRLNAWGSHVLLGLCVAGLFYIYPELAPIVAALVFFGAIYRWRAERARVGPWLLAGTTSATFALALTWPFLPDMVAFIRNQADAGLQAGGRPGDGMYAGLLSLRFHPSAFWGLGGELPGETFLTLGNIAGLFLTGFAAVGCIRMLKSRHAGIAAWLVLVVSAALSMILAARYSYGAYKLILLAWWATGFAVVLGLDTTISILARRVGMAHASRAASIGLIAAALAHTVVRQAKTLENTPVRSIDHYRQVTEIGAAAHSKAVLVAVDDPVASQWAVYFLRDVPIELVSYRSYMAFPHVRALMERARAVSAEAIGSVLTDAQPEKVLRDLGKWRRTWSRGAYQLWAPAATDWSILTDILNPHGLETLGGRPFFWLGSDPTALHVVNSSDGVLRLQARFVAGPSIPGSPVRRLLVSTDSGHQHHAVVDDGVETIAVAVRRGKDRIVLKVLDRATAPAPGGDPRQLLLGVQDLRVYLDPPEGLEGRAQPEAVIERIENPNGLEELDGRSFFWMGGRPTIINVRTVRAGELHLSCSFTLGPSVKSAPRRLLITSDGGDRRTLQVGAGDQVISVRVPAGGSRVTLTALDEPTMLRQPNGDTRPLVIGVSGLAATLVPDAITIGGRGQVR